MKIPEKRMKKTRVDKEGVPGEKQTRVHAILPTVLLDMNVKRVAKMKMPGGKLVITWIIDDATLSRA